jgi:predicted DNA binding CopG/RHH family protein
MERAVKMERITLFLTVSQVARMKQRAAQIGVPMAEYVRRVLDQALAWDEEREHERKGVAHG